MVDGVRELRVLVCDRRVYEVDVIGPCIDERDVEAPVRFLSRMEDPRAHLKRRRAGPWTANVVREEERIGEPREPPPWSSLQERRRAPAGQLPPVAPPGQTAAS